MFFKFSTVCIKSLHQKFSSKSCVEIMCRNPVSKPCIKTLYQNLVVADFVTNPETAIETKQLKPGQGTQTVVSSDSTNGYILWRSTGVESVATYSALR